MKSFFDIYMLLITSLFVYDIFLMDVTVFSYSEYRAFIRARVDAESSWGAWAKLAKAAGCKPTYLSQAIREKCHLTADHLMGIANYWNLSNVETDFLFLLLEHGRAGTKNLRDHLHLKIQRIRKERENLSKRLQKPRIEIGERETLYYSAWYWSALHSIVSIPEYRTLDAISKRLELPAGLVESTLQRLEEFGLVKKEQHEWKHTGGDFHIPNNSPLVGGYHNHWRQRAALNAMTPGSDSVHYTAVSTMSKADYQSLKERILEFIERSRRQIEISKEEEVVCFACDFFKV